MSLIDIFLERYTREYDFYNEAARICDQICTRELEQNGIRAIVTHRAKRTDRLRDKLIERNKEKKYKEVDDIYEDLVDLAGTRIALYFPGDIIEVENLIYKTFNVIKTKIFPQDAKPPNPKKRFAGYSARHYLVQLKPSELTKYGIRYSNAIVEIQVASVLIHAWSEVEHDLAYKPQWGDLSEEEYAILDELNGLVLAGEIALERLQKAGSQRLKVKEGKFRNHYELANYIYEKVSDRN